MFTREAINSSVIPVTSVRPNTFMASKAINVPTVETSWSSLCPAIRASDIQKLESKGLSVQDVRAISSLEAKKALLQSILGGDKESNAVVGEILKALKEKVCWCQYMYRVNQYQYCSVFKR